MKFLIVEDDFIFRTMLFKILKEYGEVEQAENGEIGIEKLKESLEENKPYDFVFLDIMMPVIDGNTVLKKYRDMKTDAKTKIIMLTAIDSADIIAESYINNCDAYLSKPVSKIKILDTLKRFTN